MRYGSWILLLTMALTGCRQMRSEVLVSVSYQDGPVNVTLTQRVR